MRENRSRKKFLQAFAPLSLRFLSYYYSQTDWMSGVKRDSTVYDSHHFAASQNKRVSRGMVLKCSTKKLHHCNLVDKFHIEFDVSDSAILCSRDVVQPHIGWQWNLPHIVITIIIISPAIKCFFFHSWNTLWICGYHGNNVFSMCRGQP